MLKREEHRPVQKNKEDIIQLILADTSQITLSGISALLSQHVDFEIIGETQRGTELFELIRTKRPNIVISDVNFVDLKGYYFTRRLRQEHELARKKGESFPPILIYSDLHESILLWDLLGAGIGGYLLKNEPEKMLMHALRKISGGDTFLSQPIQNKLILDLPYLMRELSELELCIIKNLAAGHNEDEISNRLDISKRSVKEHLNQVYRKLPWIRNRSEIISWAYLSHLLPSS